MSFTNSREVEEKRLEIITYIKRYISKNHLAPDDKIPSENELSQRFNANRNTVRSALLGLKIQGLIYSQKGKGFFVSKKPEHILINQNESMGLSEALSTHNIDYSIELLNISKRIAKERECKILSLAPSSMVYELEQLRYAAGNPLAICYSIIPEKIAPQLEERISANQDSFLGTSDIFVNAYGYKHPTCVKTIIRALPPSEKDIKLLEILDNIPILQQENIYEIENGIPNEYFIIRGRSDIFRIGFNFDK